MSVAYEPILEVHEQLLDDLKLRLRDVERTADTLRLRAYPVRHEDQLNAAAPRRAAG